MSKLENPIQQETNSQPVSDKPTIRKQQPGIKNKGPLSSQNKQLDNNWGTEKNIASKIGCCDDDQEYDEDWCRGKDQYREW